MKLTGKGRETHDGQRGADKCLTGRGVEKHTKGEGVRRNTPFLGQTDIHKRHTYIQKRRSSYRCDETKKKDNSLLLLPRCHKFDLVIRKLLSNNLYHHDVQYRELLKG